ncbi:hypothetical protein LTR10_000817 [Elasticomyces elasticus]|nr:hypothetical protein LTR10_000817 [Elasticomyces elasticus]KAK4979937.1 hypothetical protein LTR42_000244 [Elasticomyces elasticus]
MTDAHNAERTIIQLKLELQAARTELKEVRDTAGGIAADIQQIKDAAAADKTAHTHNLVAAYSKEILKMCEAAQKNGEELMAENRALRKKAEELESARSASTVEKEANEVKEEANEVKEKANEVPVNDLQESSVELPRRFVSELPMPWARH